MKINLNPRFDAIHEKPGVKKIFFFFFFDSNGSELKFALLNFPQRRYSIGGIEKERRMW